MKPRHRRRQRRSRPVRLVFLLLVLATIISATYAFAATISVPPNEAGSGNAAIVTAPTSTIVYTYDSSNPQRITSWAITFTSSIPATGATVRSRILSSAGMTLCSYTPPTATCTLGTSLQISQTAPNTLRIVVVS